ncbi:uncharacterized protein (TIGR02246 family) [Albidovulum inexpectatum]|uniref:Uncharacterized protein (TIGR02246 family) n=1 Tax=Albidovulum inexpectatum TaxID=196587 RepID=A0A2S5JIF6_9RHOB|nr:SgcJ/EcaC family oxidoreductase [Albidovulum inexpectatum]PPB81229.1 uncharacterized protein (TIGR02246 family) [Albidovulum inexpectatum]
MTLGSPEDFARAFAAAWSRREPEEIADLFAPDADLLTLTGAWAEGRDQIAEILAQEMAGAFVRARMVTGRGKIRSLATGVVQIMQRYVLSGIVNEDGSDAGRVGAVLSAVLTEGEDGWRVVSAQFAAEV